MSTSSQWISHQPVGEFERPNRIRACGALSRQSVLGFVVRHAVEDLGRQFLELGGQTLGFPPGRFGLPVLAPDHVPTAGAERDEQCEVEE